MSDSAVAVVQAPWLTRFAPGFAVGVCSLLFFPVLPAPPGLLMALGVLLLAYRKWRLARCLAPVALGFVWAWMNASWQLSQVLPEDAVGKDWLIQGVVIGLPEQRPGRTRFLFKMDTRNGETLAFAQTVRLSWYKTPPDIVPGQRWEWVARLKPPHGFANAGGFDYAGWLFRQGVKATGYVRAKQPHRLLSDKGRVLDRWRWSLRERIARFTGPTPGGALILALSLGDRSAIGRQQWDTLTRTGTNHLIAISGLHVSIVAGLAFFLIQFGWRRSQRLSELMASARVAALGAILMAAAYSALAGFALSTQRALIMLAVVFGALFLRRTLQPWSALSMALLLVLLFDPTASLAYGFWLSFGAVALLLYGMGMRVGATGFVWKWSRAQWVVGLGLLPMLLLLFGRASLLAPLINLFLVPLFSILLLPLVLAVASLSLLFDAPWPLQALADFLALGLDALSWAASLDWAAWRLSARSYWVWLLAFAAILLLLAPRGLPGRWLGLPMLLPMLLRSAEPPPEGAFRFSLLDVGQGLASVVQTHRHTLVFDTGIGLSSGFNTGQAVIAPFLQWRGVERVDRLVVSHADKDHAGGMPGLLAAIPVGEIHSGEPAELGREDVLSCRAGEHWRWDGVDFRFLHPNDADWKAGNNRSCVLKIENASGSVLLTGDAGRSVEQDLVNNQGAVLASTVLVAGHHGSNTSTSALFLAAVRPDYLLFSAGYHNRYGFPRPEVKRRAEEYGVAMLSTVEAGQIDFLFPQRGEVEGPFAYRRAHKRYWLP